MSSRSWPDLGAQLGQFLVRIGPLLVQLNSQPANRRPVRIGSALSGRLVSVIGRIRTTQM